MIELKKLGYMKQHINPEKLTKLSRDAQNRLLSWWKPKMGDLFTVAKEIIWVTKVCRFEEDGFIYEDKWYDPKNEITYLAWSKYHKDACLPILSIGQMIELLGDGWIYDNHINSSNDVESYTIIDNSNLCDALWEAVVEYLK